VSPLSLRRHRAERLLREEFEGLRGRVLANVRGRLRASAVSLDQDDLEACYAVAWQGLYMAVLEGEEIESPVAWLTTVTFRRAIDEHRARIRAHCGEELSTEAGVDSGAGVAGQTETVAAHHPDLAAELDDRARLRQLFEGLRGRLDGREREAATLCYLQGLSRQEAAARMGVSEARMRKLMEGRGPGRPGVAGKVGELVQAIREGAWCEQQGSLMRAFAFGILDADGERYRLALLHSGQCPACRAYVASLRGLAVVLPPVCLPGAAGAALLARAGEGAHVARVVGGGGGGGGGVTGAGLQAGRGVGGTLSASGAAGAGAGAAGGGWLVGPLGAKLAVGCLLALGVGAGCVALDGAHHEHPRHRPRGAPARSAALAVAPAVSASELAALAAAPSAPSARTEDGTARSLTPTQRAAREFGPEQALASDASRGARNAAGRAPTARSASSPQAGSASAPSDVSGPWQAAPQPGAGDSAAAEREFSPG
jgi:RNA polymerase sigma factor (sigma-70 family)